MYHYYTDLTVNQVNKLKELGINLKVGLDTLEIEKGSLYEKIKPYLEEWGLEKDKALRTYYTKNELDEASVLIYEGSWTNGYPQPDNDWPESQTTYDVSRLCNECGVGKVQKEPFRLKKTPVWKSQSVFDLEWVFDELFVKKGTYETLFKPFGIDCWPVMLYKKEIIIEDTVQLKLPISNTSPDLSKQPFKQCSTCGIKKYSPQIEGLFPKIEKPEFAICRSKEYQGFDHAADKWIFITQELRQKMIVEGIKIDYLPCAK